MAFIWTTHYTKTSFVDNNFKENKLITEAQYRENLDQGKVAALMTYQTVKLLSLIPVSGKHNKKYTLVKGNTVVRFSQNHLKELLKKYNDADQVFEFIKSRHPDQKDIELKDTKLRGFAVFSRLIGFFGIIALFVASIVFLTDRHFSNEIAKPQKFADVKVGDYVELKAVPLDEYYIERTSSKTGSKSRGSTYYLVSMMEDKEHSAIVKLPAKSDLIKTITEDYDKEEFIEYTFMGKVKNTDSAEKVNSGKSVVSYFNDSASKIGISNPGVLVDGAVEVATFDNTYLPLIIIVSVIAGGFVGYFILLKLNAKKITDSLGLS